MHAALAATLVLASLAGCLAAPQETVPTQVAPEGPLLGALSGLPTDPRGSASLAEPPAWRLGEWWRVAFEAPPYGVSAEVVVVVAGVDGDRYLVGASAETFDDAVILLHFPGFGEVDRATLGFDAHDRPFRPLSFPLVEGAAWETQWYSGAPLEAVVASADGGVATVEMTGARRVELTYDASIGAIRSFRVDGYGGYEVLEHGFNFVGDVRVPAGQDLVFCHGRAMVVQAVDLCAVRPPTSPATGPTDRVDLSDAYDRASFGLFVADAVQPPAGPLAPGMVHVEATAPDGTVYTLTKPPTARGMLLAAYGMDDPGGTWEVTAVAGGAGIAILEGVAYRALDVALGP